jgi:transposase InsO family protein
VASPLTEEGAAGLADRSSPLHSPRRTDDRVTDLLRMAHCAHERWGARKIKRWLEDRGHVLPAFSTVHNLMARHGLLPGGTPGIPATGRFEHSAPNQLWQMDFKGHFPLPVAAATRSPCWMTIPGSRSASHTVLMNGSQPSGNSW